MESQSPRELAAILFADIVGYTAIMQRNEDLALQHLTDFKAQIESAVTQHHGQIIQYYGDGCLAVFRGSADAVASAMLMQEAFRDRVPVRIGLHAGEVVFREDNVYGDAVNIASRIESEGIAGSILLSSTIRHQIKNRLEFQLASLGRFEFKNVEGGMSVYAIANEGFPIPGIESKTPRLRPTQQKGFSWYATATLLTFVVVGLLGYFFSNPDQPTGQRFSLAILPFSIRGSDDVAFLREGMTDLLSTKLDGMGPLRTVDPNAILGFMSKEGHSSTNPEVGQLIATRFNADRFVIGSVTKIANQLQFTARLYDKDGQVLNQVELEEDGQNLGHAIDAVAIQLVAKEMVIEGTDVMHTGAHGTENTEALRLFLEGEQAYRKLAVIEAIDKYTQALELDPTFALACLRLIKVNGWDQSSLADARWIDTLISRRHQLPDKYQKLAEVELDYYRRNVDDVMRGVEQLYREYPNDIEIMLMMGEVNFHYNPLRGKSRALAKKYFEEAQRLDAGNHESLIHLFTLYKDDGEEANRDRIVEQINQIPYFQSRMRTVPLFYEQDPLKKERMIKELASDPKYIPMNILGYLRSEDNIKEVLDFALAVNEAVQNQFHLHLIKYHHLATHGRFAEAKAIASSYFPPGLVSYGSSHYLGNPEFPVHDRKLSELRKMLSGSKSEFSSFPGLSENYFYEAQCLYNALLGDRDSVQYYLSQIRSLAVDPDYMEYPEFIEHKIEALMSYRRGQNDQALAHIDAAMAKSLAIKDRNNDSYRMPHLRFIKACILKKQGHLQEALQWLENFITHSDDTILIPWCYFKQAQIYELLGETDNAIKYYDKFIEIYQDCDEALQRHVVEAKERRSTLFAKTL